MRRGGEGKKKQIPHCVRGDIGGEERVFFQGSLAARRAAGGGAGAFAGAGARAPGAGVAGDGGGGLWNNSGGAGAQRADDREQRFVDCGACQGRRVDAGDEQRAGVSAGARIESGELGGVRRNEVLGSQFSVASMGERKMAASRPGRDKCRRLYKRRMASLRSGCGCPLS
jgi:hypothetical protein